MDGLDGFFDKVVFGRLSFCSFKGTIRESVCSFSSLFFHFLVSWGSKYLFRCRVDLDMNRLLKG